MSKPTVLQSGACRAVPLSHLRALVEGRPWTLSDFDIRPTVAVRTYSRVRVVKIKGSADRTPFALKFYKKHEVLRLKQVEHVKSERQILSMVDHPFIVSLLATFEDEKRLFLLTEYVNGGELFSYLKNGGRLLAENARFYTGEIILALGYLHTLRVAYRDLKPENVLTDCEGHVKMVEFGFAKVVADRTWTLCGTPEYLAPEVIQSKGHGLGVDWWTLGILLFEILVGYPPFYDDNPFGIYKKVLAGQIEFPGGMDLKAKDLIKRLLTYDQGKRLGCLKDGVDDVKRHKYYKSLDWDLLGSRSLPPPFVPPVAGVDDISMFEQYPESEENDAPPLSPEEQRRFEGFLGSAART